jgi:class 3 adenylate cyclase
VGDTPNLAARVQADVEPGTIIIAASTRRCLVSFPSFAISATTTSRVWPNRSRLGPSRACRRPKVASKRFVLPASPARRPRKGDRRCSSTATNWRGKAKARFAIAVDAVACVIAVQRPMVQRNADGSKDRLVQNRVGINIDDIIVELLYPADRSEHSRYQCGGWPLASSSSS